MEKVEIVKLCQIQKTRKWPELGGSLFCRNVINSGHFWFKNRNFHLARARRQNSDLFPHAMKAIKKSSITDDSAGYMQERDILEFGRSWDRVIKLHYSFQDDKCLYFVMDFMAGGDLVRLLEHYEFSEMHVQFYAAECINGINAIHKFGYIHRDIKPDNVLPDNKGHVKIGDFGT